MGDARGKSLYRRPRSARETELLEKARRLLPAGVRTPTFSPEHAIVVESARGARIRDESGNEYIDYLLGSGPMLLGHAHPAVVARRPRGRSSEAARTCC